VGTLIIIAVVKMTVGLRISEDTENMGLDQAEHGESAYHQE
jgi:ammonia channel protein AmtB